MNETCNRIEELQYMCPDWLKIPLIYGVQAGVKNKNGSIRRVREL